MKRCRAVPAGLRANGDRLAQGTVRDEIVIVAAEVGVELDEATRQNVVVVADLLKVLLLHELLDRRVNVFDCRKLHVLAQHRLDDLLRFEATVLGDDRLQGGLQHFQLLRRVDRRQFGDVVLRDAVQRVVGIAGLTIGASRYAQIKFVYLRVDQVDVGVDLVFVDWVLERERERRNFQLDASLNGTPEKLEHVHRETITYVAIS